MCGALLCLLIPFAAFASQLTVEVPYELYTTPKYGMATLTCTLAAPDCKSITSKRKTLKFKGKAPHKGKVSLSFTGSSIDGAVDVKCEIKAIGDKVINAMSTRAGSNLQCGKWKQAITMEPVVAATVGQSAQEAGKFGNWAHTNTKAVNINQSHRGTNTKAVNINQSHRGANTKAVNINQGYRGTNTKAVNINQKYGVRS
jgi:hypothetical protein